jgi:hypothetical protein
VDSSVTNARHLTRKVSTVPTVRTLLNGSQSHKAETLLSSISCRALDWNVFLTRAVHSAVGWNEIKPLRIAGK